MKSEKHLQKKQEIIDTAFKVWNRSCYFSTSLNDIAESLKVTKQAIYRYFKGKKDLLYAMENQIVEDYGKNSEKIISEIETLSTSEAVEWYIMNQISFFRKHKVYLTFLISKIRLKDNDQKEFQKIVLKQSDFLEKKLSLPLSAVNYILNLIVFYLLIGEKDSTEKMTKKITGIFLNGFGTTLLAPPENSDEILQNTRIPANNDQDDNRVLQAISEAVLEEGPQVSLGKIAKKAGMTKSSLYFYFKNKEEMIIQTMNGQTEQFIEYYYEKLSSYTHIGEQLFAHFAITASTTIERPKTVPLIHWFITRGMAENFKKPTDFVKYRTFFENATNNGFLNTHGVTADQLIMLVNFCITYEVNNIYRNEINKEEKYKLVYGLYDLFAHGLKGLNDKMGDT